MKLALVILLPMLFSNSWANTYFGLRAGYGSYTSKELSEFKVNPKGVGYGAILGMGKDFVGLEGYYEKLTTKGDIKHEGEKGTLTSDATALGVAVRFSFQSFFLRLGTGQYTLDQSVELPTESNVTPASKAYGLVESGESKNGVLLGLGVHRKLSIGRLCLDYTRHQISGGTSFDSLSLGLVWAIPDKLFSVAGK